MLLALSIHALFISQRDLFQKSGNKNLDMDIFDGLDVSSNPALFVSTDLGLFLSLLTRITEYIVGTTG
jgi:hypothetical protein